MKKPILIFLLAFLCSCKLTNQQKAEHLVKTYLDSALNDPHSYENVKFLPVQKHYDKSGATQIMNGWEITHICRAKNGFGALGLHTTVFQIDSSMTRVEYGDEVK